MDDSSSQIFLGTENLASEISNPRFLKHLQPLSEVQAMIENHLNNSIYQDGIRQPIEIDELIPLGFYRGTANFTGESRLRLNIGRNYVDESPKLLRLWMKTVGSTIQEKLLKSLFQHMKNLNLNPKVDILALIPKRKTPSFLWKLAEENLKTLINKE